MVDEMRVFDVCAGDVVAAGDVFFFNLRSTAAKRASRSAADWASLAFFVESIGVDIA